jgi:hypothetical protein
MSGHATTVKFGDGLGVTDEGSSVIRVDAEGVVWDDVGDDTPGVVTADEVPITDAGGYFTGTDVEAALQELGAAGGGGGGGGAGPADAAAWMPLTSTVGGDDVLVFDADHSLIPTLVPF